MGEENLLEGIVADSWNTFASNVSVYYNDGPILRAIKNALDVRKPDIIYINGLFVPQYNWLPLLLSKQRRISVVIAPRGMVQAGALAIKPFKKKIFLATLKLLRFHDNVIWHATDNQELHDIKKIFGANSSVFIAPNVPKFPLRITRTTKAKNTLRLVYLSLITEKKNLHIVLEALRDISDGNIIFDIYGPVIDKEYWGKCQPLMVNSKHNIKYKGTLNPACVQETLALYDVFILPTRGENFGHAIYEALSVGTPALITPHTPWGYLEEQQAGLTVCSFRGSEWASAIQRIWSMKEEEYIQLSHGAFKVASDYFSKSEFREAYLKLFV